MWLYHCGLCRDVYVIGPITHHHYPEDNSVFFWHEETRAWWSASLTMFSPPQEPH